MSAVRKLNDQELLSARALIPTLGMRDVLIFDGDCRFCNAQAARLQRQSGPMSEKDPRPWLDMLPLQTPGLLPAVGIDYDTAMSAMHIITHEGRVYRGAEAVVCALRHRPILGRLLLLYYVPGLRQLADLGYWLIARYRYALMGRAVARGECDGACAIHAKRPPKLG